MQPTKRLHSSLLKAGAASPDPKRERANGAGSPRAVGSPSGSVAESVSGAVNGSQNGVTAALEPLVERFTDARTEQWQRTMQKVVRSVVSVHFSCPTPFDTEGSYVSEATGFIVDAKAGIIMTNRHVVGPGPFCGFAVFDNHEECPVHAIYRDPVHDFGFLRFDPAKIRHMPVQDLELSPERAVVSREIRVVGNDAGEKLSILAGFISRLDRNAPEYGDLTYNDFNTEYIQAAASASGGSSGSPVVDIDGKVLALQAGGSTTSSTDFFLPLYRGKRALECLQQGKPVTRGTIQVQWLLKPFDECGRLGLTLEEENAAREAHPGSIGLLVAETILPEGPACQELEEGDVLLEVNGVPTAQFRDVDAVLDSSVGETITMTVMRNGERVTQEFVVQDLHAITPSRYVEVAGAVLHDLSYQVARLYAIPVEGVYVAETGQVFRPDRETSGWLLEELDHRPTPNLDAFLRVVESIPDCERVAARFRHVTDLHTVKNSIINMDRHWHRDIVLATRNDKSGLWDLQTLGSPLPPKPLATHAAAFPPDGKLGESPAASGLARSFVKVETRVPLTIEGYSAPDVNEYGLVVDAEQGYVMVSRFCVPHYLCDVSVVVAESVIVPAKVVFLHPQQNFAIIKFDRSLVDAPLKSMTFSDTPLEQGQVLDFFGWNHNMRVFSTKTKVNDISTVYIPVGGDVAPRYRATNVDSVGLDAPMISDCSSGVLTDDNGVVRAWWSSFLGDVNATGRDRQFRLALDTSTIAPTLRGLVAELQREASLPAQADHSLMEIDEAQEVIAAVEARDAVAQADDVAAAVAKTSAADAADGSSNIATDAARNPRFVDVEVAALQLVAGRIRGVSEEWLQRAQQAHPMRPQLFQAWRVSSPLLGIIREGDVIVALDGELLTSASQLMNLHKKQVTLTVIRAGEQREIAVNTTPSESVVTRSMVAWCGMLVHAPHHAVLQQIREPPSHVYVVHVSAGSPASQYGLSATHFVTHVAGKAVQTVDDFYKVVSEIPDQTYVKLRVVTFDELPCACSLRTDYHYFKTWRRDLVDGEWRVQRPAVVAPAESMAESTAESASA